MNLNFYLNPDPNEKPLDNIVDDGGFIQIFRKIAYVGDSLASGEFESFDENGHGFGRDLFEYSWGQYIARAAGNTALNFSRGGMSAKEYCTGFADSHDYWNPDMACQAYVIALGVNDLVNAGWEIGTTADINKNDWHDHADTYAGYMGEIVLRYKEISPNAKFFFVSMPREGNRADKIREKQRDFLATLADFFDNAYLIDLIKYAPVYDSKYYEMFGLHSHLNPMGYILSAKTISSYIDYIIRHNLNDFKQAAFIGTPWYDKNFK